ncbi:MAG TPA: YhjD/YihY/BrkB family envelope integrity protein [Verrucomicrobiota bacterium]|nr:YhjD/YihY/BrkB family envelope integrity protein [Verrucomicrobiota bacterium]
MFKKRFARLTQLVTGQRGADGEDWFALESGLTWVEKFIHFWVLVGQSFIRNRCPIRASALSYSSLLALIPMLALGLSVASSLLKAEGEDKIYQFIDHFVASVVPPAEVNTNKSVRIAPPLLFDDEAMWNAYLDGADTNATASTVSGTNGPPVATAEHAATTDGDTNAVASITDPRVVTAQKEAARHIHDFIQNTQSGALGLTGVVLLLSMAFVMLSRVEETFNDIWGVTRGRNVLLRVVTYWGVITLGPVMLALALALWGGAQFQATKDMVGGTVAGQLLLQAVPLAMLWIGFASLYKLVPNTKVNYSAAFVGGAVAGTLWLVNNMFGFLYVSRVVVNSKIYGSLGLVPVFMAGLFLSWLILLLGAQIAYAFQNRSAYLQERLVENVNQRGREFVALRLMTCICQRFQRSLPPPSVANISSELGIPSRLVQQVLQVLIAARLVVEVSRGEAAYAPARPLEDINAHHVLVAMRATVGQELLTRDEPVRAEVLGEFARIQDAEKAAASSVTMLVMVNRAQARLELAAPKSGAEQEKLVPAFVAATAASAAGTAAATAGETETSRSAAAPAVDVVTEPFEKHGIPTANEVAARESKIEKGAAQTSGAAQSDVAPHAPVANVTTDDNQSFPL